VANDENDSVITFALLGCSTQKQHCEFEYEPEYDVWNVPDVLVNTVAELGHVFTTEKFDVHLSAHKREQSE
jgi:hypothetical protein